MSWDPAPPVEHAEPVHRLVVEEIAQLLGYDPARVAGITMEPRRVTVYAYDDARAVTEHRHPVL